MNIKINKDFLTEYKNDFWKGFDPHELLYLGIALVIAFCTTLICYFVFHISPSNAIYIAVPISSPAVIIGFYKYQGYLSVRQWIKELRFTHKCRILSYQSYEEERMVNIFNMQKYNGKRGKRKNGISFKSK